MVSTIVTLANLFKVRIEDIFFNLKPNYNIAPGQDIVIVIKDQEKTGSFYPDGVLSLHGQKIHQQDIR